MDITNGRQPMVWALTPHLVRDGKLVGESYDNEQTKTEVAAAFHSLGMPWIWQPVVPASIGDVVAQIAKYREKNDAVIFNFCDGDDINGYPGLSILKALEASGIPFTGAHSPFYELSTSKIVMKRALCSAGVSNAPFAVLPQTGPLNGLCERLGTPLFVKPAISAAGWGLTLRSVVHSDAEIEACRAELLSGDMAQYFLHDTLFAERFVEGPEFTVFLGGYHDCADEIWVLPPAERVFDAAIPPKQRILCNERLGRPYYWYEACAPEMDEPLRRLAVRAYCAVQGTGYGRVDIRQDSASGELYVLEVNANPGISGDEDVVSVGRILQLAGMTFADLLAAILRQTICRAERA
jgi:D-alanine-D-alanine ligase-like ATP-grasp enzyme